MQEVDLLLDSDDRDRGLWPTATNHELALPNVLRNVERLQLVWIFIDPPLPAPVLLRLGPERDHETVVDTDAFAVISKSGGFGLSASGGTDVAAGDKTYTDKKTLSRLRMSLTNVDGSDLLDDETTSVRMLLRALVN